MPGPYAHITLLYELLRPDRPGPIFTPSSACHDSLVTCFHFCVLGAVSPDYPNLAGGNAVEWAEAMHCFRACEMIASGIRRVIYSKGIVRAKQLAWLLGYCAHVVTDVTIHPVVEARVGVYAENQRQHRICEMNQDSHIYRRMNLGEIGASDKFALTVAQCGDANDRTRLDRDIVSLWQGMLEDVYPELSAIYPPDCAAWHREFVAVVDGYGTDSMRLFPLAGAIAAKMELAYPAFEIVDKQFIEEQMIPSEKTHCLHYDDIFNSAARNVEDVWGLVAQTVFAVDEAYQFKFDEWNLDTGRDEHGRLVFWSAESCL
ncbi:MAG: zinc dependent phospholipase C family protein [Deltaproteobacteria bacterium]|nr:zinc dependent phospholipase C family protein [Deltaproteobacteria bacterium]